MPTSVSQQGRELIASATHIDRGVAEWVFKLADFDASGDWASDGFASCVNWLIDRCEMSRSDAFEKLKVSHELRRREIVREAFEGGLPYSKVRVLVRLDRLDEDRDAEFVAHAAVDSVRVLEDRVRTWNYYHREDPKLAHLDDHYGMHRVRGSAIGIGKVIIEGPDDMLDRLFAIVDAYGEFLFRKPPDESTQWTHPQDEEADSRPLTGRRLDWLLDVVEERALTDPGRIDPYLAAVGVTIRYEDLIAGTGTGLTSGGSVLTGEAVRRLCCDAGIHRVVVKGASEVLDFGREERLFDRKLRRLIRFRHSHVCAVRGCGRRMTQIHHRDWWEHGGETNVDNGLPLCGFHHHLVHDAGWIVEWEPSDGIVRLIGPEAQVLLTTASFGLAA